MTSLPFLDNFLTDTTGNYSKSGTWTWNSGQYVAHASTSQDFMVQDVGQSDLLEVVGSIVVTSAPISTNDYLGVQLAANNLTAGSNRGYIICFRGLGTTPDYNNIWLLDSNIAWVTSGAFTWTTGIKYWLKIRRIGTTIYCRIWQDGNAEPSTWTITATVTARTDTQIGFASSTPGDTVVGNFSNLSGISLIPPTKPININQAVHRASRW
ncbi:MAG: hypothetical protein KGI08_04785 [Thaumarchaeota archaeon]|nr:hypothetical protein [Nitrososphaerota archaeon]